MHLLIATLLKCTEKGAQLHGQIQFPSPNHSRDLQVMSQYAEPCALRNGQALPIPQSPGHVDMSTDSLEKDLSARCRERHAGRRCADRSGGTNLPKLEPS